MEKLKLLLKIFQRYRTEKFSELLVSHGAMAILIVATVGLVALFHSMPLSSSTVVAEGQPLVYELALSPVKIAAGENALDKLSQFLDPWVEELGKFHGAVSGQDSGKQSFIYDLHAFFKSSADSLIHARAGPPAVRNFFARLAESAGLSNHLSFTKLKINIMTNKSINGVSS